MTKTLRQLRTDLPIVDVVVELLDARIPRSSKNPDVDDLAAGKRRIVALNKADLRRELLSGFAPLSFTATVISLDILENIFPLLLSCAPFLYIIFLNCECPAISILK
jgi:hypothetical protein